MQFLQVSFEKMLKGLATQFLQVSFEKMFKGLATLRWILESVHNFPYRKFLVIE